MDFAKSTHEAELQRTIAAVEERIQDGKKAIIQAEAIIALAESGDKGAPFELAALVILRETREQSEAYWQRQRERLKKAGVGITELEKLMSGKDDSSNSEPDKTIADQLIKLARSECKLVHDAKGDCFAVFVSSGARQVFDVNAPGFSEFLSHAYYKDQDRAPSDSSLKVALATLRGQAKFEGETCEVYTRVAKVDGYWLDLCNEAWECIHITSTGWKVVSCESAPLFTRTASMLPLPNPTS